MIDESTVKRLWFLSWQALQLYEQSDDSCGISAAMWGWNHGHGGTPIAGWFIMENLGWFGSTSGWCFGTSIINIFFTYIGFLIIPTDEIIFFSEGWRNHQPVLHWHAGSRGRHARDYLPMLTSLGYCPPETLRRLSACYGPPGHGDRPFRHGDQESWDFPISHQLKKQLHLFQVCSSGTTCFCSFPEVRGWSNLCESLTLKFRWSTRLLRGHHMCRGQNCSRGDDHDPIMEGSPCLLDVDAVPIRHTVQCRTP